MRPPALLVIALLGTTMTPPANAQASAIAAEVTRDYQMVRSYFLQAAEEMPDSLYSFRPAPSVRTFAQQVAHVADDQYNLCSPARGQIRHAAYKAIEDSLSAKPALLTALKEAFAYCDPAYDSLTVTAGARPADPAGRTRFGYLNWNMWHTWEHYGNVVIYLRLNHLVPPSSQPMGGMRM
jgi:hypothetical protein